MCGIAGIIGRFNESDGHHLIENMLKVIEHRGPDSKGIWVQDNVAFGMQRLSIIDLPGGDQPIWSDSGVGIVFNGEIYNYKEIKNILTESNVSFKTSSDTEVILQLYIQKGIKAIHSLEGMFSICIYDPNEKKFFLIRDRLGIKPLYYHTSKDCFIFASEIKSILEATPEKPSLNLNSVNHYLTFRYVPPPESIWESILKLDPGHYLEYDLENRSHTIKKYWSLEVKEDRKSKNANPEKEFEYLFMEAVEKRLLAADVPVGILLSGGIDSSCVVAAAAELGHKNFHTFSIGFEDGGDYSELKYAKQMADHVGAQHHEIVISKDEFLGFVDDFVWYSDEPLADLASIPLYFVSKLAAKYVKVVLSGEGADEIFAGYNIEKLARKLSILKYSSYIPSFILNRLPYESPKKMAAHGYSDFLKHTQAHMTNVFSDSEKVSLCKFIPSNLSSQYIESLYLMSNSENPIEQLLQVYSHSWLVEDLLMKADKMSMATSLELRIPFLDHKLVEWASKLPIKWKVGSHLGGFKSKKILRKFAEKRLPENIVNRPKKGFPVPAYEWVKSDLDDLIVSEFNSPDILSLFNKEGLDKLQNDLKGSDPDVPHKVWNILILSRWLQKWNH